MAARKSSRKIDLSHEDFVKKYLALSPSVRKNIKLSSGGKLDKFLMGDLKLYNVHTKKKKRINFALIARAIYFYKIKNKTKYRMYTRKLCLPRMNKVEEFFGSFDNLLRIVWGEEEFNKILENRNKCIERITRDRSVKIITPERLLALVNQYSLYERSDYKYACQKFPEIIPSIKYVENNFGSFDRMVYVAKRMVVSGVAEIYMAFRHRYGKFATILDCEKIGLHKIKFLMDIYGSKAELDKFFEEMYQKRQEVDYLNDVKTRYEKLATTAKDANK